MNLITLKTKLSHFTYTEIQFFNPFFSLKISIFILLFSLSIFTESHANAAININQCMSTLFQHTLGLPLNSPYGKQLKNELYSLPHFQQLIEIEMSEPQSLMQDLIEVQKLQKKIESIELKLIEQFEGLDGLMNFAFNLDPIAEIKEKQFKIDLDNLEIKINELNKKIKKKKSPLLLEFEKFMRNRLRSPPEGSFDFKFHLGDFYYTMRNKKLAKVDPNPELKEKLENEIILYLSSTTGSLSSIREYLQSNEISFSPDSSFAEFLDYSKLFMALSKMSLEERWKIFEKNTDLIDFYSGRLLANPTSHLDDLKLYFKKMGNDPNLLNFHSYQSFLLSFELQKIQLSQSEIKEILISLSNEFPENILFLKRFLTGTSFFELKKYEEKTKKTIAQIEAAAQQGRSFPEILKEESLSSIFYYHSKFSGNNDFLDSNQNIGKLFYSEFSRRLEQLEPDPLAFLKSNIEPKAKIGAWTFYQVLKKKPQLALPHYFNFIQYELLPDIFRVATTTNSMGLESTKLSRTFNTQQMSDALIAANELNFAEILLHPFLKNDRHEISKLFENFSLHTPIIHKYDSPARRLTLDIAAPNSPAFSRARYEALLISDGIFFRIKDQTELFQTNSEFKKHAQTYLKWLLENPKEFLYHLHHDYMIQDLLARIPLYELVPNMNEDEIDFIHSLLKHDQYLIDQHSALKDLIDVNQISNIRVSLLNTWLKAARPDFQTQQFEINQHEQYIERLKNEHPDLLSETKKNLDIHLESLKLNYDLEFQKVLQKLPSPCIKALHDHLNLN